ncbi:N-acetyltransferase family protein [Demequina sp.]|uniref:GNAT family N-acetyltransferase n=1 Tax=Demequina sp. TaxID=2050685 RepID=UPI003D09E155
MIHADVSARPAVPGDEAAIAAIQLASWRSWMGDAVDQLPATDIEQQWAQAICSPPSRQHRVFVATDGPRVVGFAALAPTEIIALEVAPESRRQGHGSRLLAACVDTLRTANATEVRAWALEGDTVRETFLSGAGLGAGGVRRVLEGPDGELAERLWVASL